MRAGRRSTSILSARCPSDPSIVEEEEPRGPTPGLSGARATGLAAACTVPLPSRCACHSSTMAPPSADSASSSVSASPGPSPSPVRITTSGVPLEAGCTLKPPLSLFFCVRAWLCRWFLSQSCEAPVTNRTYCRLRHFSRCCSQGYEQYVLSCRSCTHFRHIVQKTRVGSTSPTRGSARSCAARCSAVRRRGSGFVGL